ncbi:predicted protein, partial [Streptomyces sp. SPB78]
MGHSGKPRPRSRVSAPTPCPSSRVPVASSVSGRLRRAGQGSSDEPLSGAVRVVGTYGGRRHARPRPRHAVRTAGGPTALAVTESVPIAPTTTQEGVLRRQSLRESAARTYARALPIVPVRARGLTIEG